MAAPSTAQITIKVANQVVSVLPRNFMSLRMKRLAGDTCNSFTLQILDDDAFTIEYALLNNTGGAISFSYCDYNGNVFKDFSGFVIKISDSFIDNRVMLQLEGFVGVSISEKFNKVSFNWNVVPKFEWGDIFSDASTSGLSDDQNEEDGFWEGIGNWFKNGFGSAWASLTTLLFQQDGLMKFREDTIYRSVSTNPDGVLNYVLDHLKVDSAGNYYLPNMQMTNHNSASDTAKSKNVKQSGSIIVPMKPSNIIKFIGRGGEYSELLEDDFEKYKGTEFYNGKNKVSKLDWLWIKAWYKRMGKFDGCGWKVHDSNIQDTDMKQMDFSQKKQSFLTYINKVLIPNSTKTEKKTKKSTSEDGKWVYKDTTSIVRSNFMLSFDNDGTVYFKRVNITANQSAAAAEYVLYGNDQQNLQKPAHGHLISFAPSLDILTAMITANATSGGDISNLNLVTGEPNKEYQEQVDPDEEDSLELFKNWGELEISVVGAAQSSPTGNKSLSDIQGHAEMQSYKATATIDGPCLLSPQDYISIVVMPDSSRGTVFRHHTSGLYYILGIEETIEGGRMTSSLDLVKNVASMGNTGEVTIKQRDAKRVTTDDDWYIGGIFLGIGLNNYGLALASLKAHNEYYKKIEENRNKKKEAHSGGAGRHF